MLEKILVRPLTKNSVVGFFGIFENKKKKIFFSEKKIKKPPKPPTILALPC
jgi:hypothetical protein